MPFVKGKSGNPAGRPKGLVSNVTLLAREFFQANSKEILEKFMEKVREGDSMLVKLAIDKMLPSLQAMDLTVTLDGLSDGQLKAVIDAATQKD